MNTLRWIVKQPILLFIWLVSKLKRYTLHEGFTIPHQLEHLFGYYEPETTRFFKRHIKPGMVVVDAGAKDGYFTLLFSKLVGKTGEVYAFEPDAEAFEILRKNTAHLSNVEIFPYALSDEDGWATWYHVVGAKESHSLIHDPLDAKKTFERRKVKAVTLDAVVGWKIDYIKMDVEGVEDRVFRGMKRHLKTRPFVVFEYTQGYLDSLIEELERSGTLYSMSKKGELQPFANAHYILEGRKERPDADVPGRLANIVYRPGPHFVLSVPSLSAVQC